MPYKFVVLVAGLILAGVLSARADELAPDQVFSRGTQAFYSQDYSQAYDVFNTLIETGKKEPAGFAYQELCYYYRGLCSLYLGKEETAKADFQKGAELEATEAPIRGYNVAHLLERVQGFDRQLLEQYRATARAAALQRNEDLRRQRYEQNQAAQSQVLQPAKSTASPVAASSFRMGPLPQPKVEKVQAPVAEVSAEVAADVDPFATPSEPTTKKPATGKSVAAKKAKPEAKAPPALPSAAAEDAENPFQGTTPPSKKPAAAPAKKTATVDDNPFDTPAGKPAKSQ